MVSQTTNWLRIFIQWLKMKRARKGVGIGVGVNIHRQQTMGLDEDELGLDSSIYTVQMNERYEYDESDIDTDHHDALDDSLSTVKMSDMVLSSSSSEIQMIHDALEYNRSLRIQTVLSIIDKVKKKKEEESKRRTDDDHVYNMCDDDVLH